MSSLNETVPDSAAISASLPRLWAMSVREALLVVFGALVKQAIQPVEDFFCLAAAHRMESVCERVSANRREGVEATETHRVTASVPVKENFCVVETGQRLIFDSELDRDWQTKLVRIFSSVSSLCNY